MRNWSRSSAAGSIRPGTRLRAQAELERRRRAGVRPPLWTPNPDHADGRPNPQRLAYESAADVLGYGGAAGGGKSSLLLGLAATAHRRSVIFRRVFPNLRGIIEESRALLNAEGRDHSQDSYNETLHRWALGDGRMIEFEACQYEKDREKQRGRPRDFYGFDEATEFTRSQVEFITAWNRTTEAGQRCRVVMTFNPPTDDGGSWVIEYFRPWFAHLFPQKFTHPRPAMPGELRWYATVDGKEVECADETPFEHEGEVIRPRSRTFIPARLDDNPHLAESNYRSTLQALPEPLRSQLLYGDFAAKGAADPFQIIPAEWVRRAQERWVELAVGVPAAKERPAAVGVDVARAGADRTVFAPRWGQVYGEPVVYPGVVTPDGPVVAELLRQRFPQAGVVNVDVIGVGSSAYDSLSAVMGPGTMVRPVNVSAGSTFTDRSGRLRMRNLRAELLWRMRDALDPERGSGVALPPGNEVLADLCAARYRPLAGGVVLAESKEDVKARLGRSPDVGDAILLAMYEPDSMGSWGDLEELGEVEGYRSRWQ